MKLERKKGRHFVPLCQQQTFIWMSNQTNRLRRIRHSLPFRSVLDQIASLFFESSRICLDFRTRRPNSYRVGNFVIGRRGLRSKEKRNICFFVPEGRKIYLLDFARKIVPVPEVAQPLQDWLAET